MTEKVHVGATAHYPSLAFHPTDGYPAIAYRDSAGDSLNTLMYAWYDGSSWVTETVTDPEVAELTTLTRLPG